MNCTPTWEDPHSVIAAVVHGSEHQLPEGQHDG
jgi:hypothetical protein